MSTFVPRRRNQADILLSSNPFARQLTIGDEHARRLYNAIDNQRTVQDIAAMMQISLQTTLKLLEILWRQQYIEFYSVQGGSFKEIDFAKLGGSI